MRGPGRLIFALLTRAQRRRFWLLVCLMAVMAVTELAGVALIMPFLAVVARPEVVAETPALSTIYEAGGFTDRFAFLQAMGLGVLAVVLTSIALRALTFHQVVVFARNAALTLGTALLRRYLAHPYAWFLNRHSADLGKTILEEVHDVSIGAMAPAMRILANSTVLVCIFGLLAIVEPVGALVMIAFLGVAFALIYARFDAFLLRIGRDRRDAKREKHQVTREAMAGIKEVKVMGLEDAYLGRFVEPSRRVARYQASVTLLSEMPRYVLEALGFGGMLLFVLWLLYSRDGRLEEALPIIGAFAFAGLKLMPTVQQLFADIALLRHNQPALEGLHDDLEGESVDAPPVVREGPEPEAIPLRRELKLEGVRYRYPGADRDALAGLDVTVPAGSSIGVVGSSGAGKTTAMDVILGLLEPDEGRLTVDGAEVSGPRLRAWQRGIGYVPQSIYLVDDTLAANIAFGRARDEIDHDAVVRAARLAKLDAFVDGLAEGYETMIGEAGVRLSGGQRQRVGIARALYRDPDLVVFDEATSALDTMTERAVVEAVRGLAGEKTILTVTHRLSTVQHCDTIVVLDHGRLAGIGDHRTLSETNTAYRALLDAAGAPLPPRSGGPDLRAVGP